MKEQEYVTDPLNNQASALVDAQTDIKTAIKQGVLSGQDRDVIKERVRKIIDRALEKIRSPTLKSDGKVSLMRFADRAYVKFTDELRAVISLQALPALVVLIRAVTGAKRLDNIYTPRTASEKKALQSLTAKGKLPYPTYATGITLQEFQKNEVYNPSTQTERKAFQKLAVIDPITFNTRAMGIPLHEFQKNYIQRVEKALYELAEANALDPNDFSGRNSLRNLAEMQVRYERHQEEISGFKERRTRLVVCSVHADCSKRCSGWQGRVYSLDGTSGYTEDGKRFVPLEKATDIYYTTKAGRVYKNGLLGFNCRHKLYEYKVGMEIPTVSEEERKREYEITQKQRFFERNVISAREKALSFKGVSQTEYKKWKIEAERRFRLYKAYSKEMGRAYYPDRVKIL